MRRGSDQPDRLGGQTHSHSRLWCLCFPFSLSLPHRFRAKLTTANHREEEADQGGTPCQKVQIEVSPYRQISLLPVVDGSLNVLFDAEDKAESSSCLRSDISSESSLVLSEALKWPRSPCKRVENSVAIAIGGGSTDNKCRNLDLEILPSPRSKSLATISTVVGLSFLSSHDCYW